MSWIGDTVAGLSRLIQLNADVRRLEKSVEKIEAEVLDHEIRLVRIETVVTVGGLAARLPPH